MRWMLLLALSTGVLACSHGNCRSQKNKEMADAEAKAAATQAVKPEAGGTVAHSTSTADHVKVFKPDGSLQCGQGKAISVTEMQGQLNGIKVYSSLNRNDGMMRVQVCGAPTGNVNVYEIDRKDLATALKKGFKEWTLD